MTQHVCKNCGNNFEGKFCNVCGEKVYTDHDKSMRHFFDEVFHFFSHLDNKFFKTLLLIFRKPGLLSVTYCNGIRNKYYKPISLFFIGVILYLLFPLLQGLNLSFGAIMVNLRNEYMGFIADLANQKAIAKNISMQELERRYDHISPAFAKVLLLVILPLTGIVLKGMFFKKRKYFFDYLILGTEASCIMVYLNFFILPGLLYILTVVFRLFHIKALFGDLTAIILSVAFTIFWTTKAFKRFFEISYPVAFAKGLLFLVFQSMVIYIIYRVILFLTVLLFI